MNKIRTLIGCEDENIANTVANDLNKSKFVEVVGIANNGIDTLNQIVNLKPEVVFSQYYFNNLNGDQLLEKAKEKLKDELPYFYILEDDLSHSEIEKAYRLSDMKLSGIVTKPYAESAVAIMKEFKDRTIE